MEEELIKYDTAVLARDKGFKELVYACYNTLSNIEDLNNIWHCGCEGGMELEEWFYNYNDYKHKELISAPTQSLLQKWLREVHYIYVTALPTYTGSSLNKRCFFEISFKDKTMQFGDKYGYFDTIELALESGLQEALKLI